MLRTSRCKTATMTFRDIDAISLLNPRTAATHHECNPTTTPIHRCTITMPLSNYNDATSLLHRCNAATYRHCCPATTPTHRCTLAMMLFRYNVAKVLMHRFTAATHHVCYPATKRASADTQLLLQHITAAVAAVAWVTPRAAPHWCNCTSRVLPCSQPRNHSTPLLHRTHGWRHLRRCQHRRM
jgi:hypothetical protein